MRLARVLPFAALWLAGCPASQPVDPNAPPRLEKQYPDGAEGLGALWRDILVSSQRDERQKVHDLMASQMMTDADLVAVFGAARAKDIAPRYAPMISRLINAGAMELVAQITDRKYDDVEVFPVDGTASPEDKATLVAVAPGTRVYGVRVKRKEQKTGLRYDFFVYREGRWVTGNQLGKYLLSTAGAGAAATGATAGTAATGATAGTAATGAIAGTAATGATSATGTAAASSQDHPISPPGRAPFQNTPSDGGSHADLRR